MLDPGLPALAGGKEGYQVSEPFLGAAEDVLGLEGVGQSLKFLGVATAEESVGAGEEADSALLKTLG